MSVAAWIERARAKGFKQPRLLRTYLSSRQPAFHFRSHRRESHNHVYHGKTSGHTSSPTRE